MHPLAPGEKAARLREDGFDLMWEIMLKLRAKKREAGLELEVGVHRAWGVSSGRGKVLARGMGVGVFCAYVATLPRASADTDHSRQMKSLLFLKSSRQGAATGFLL